jgi:hypothetical protein
MSLSILIALSAVILICLAMDRKTSETETNIRIKVGSVNLSFRTAPGPISISVSGSAASSSVTDGQTGATTLTFADNASGAACSIPYPQQAAPGAASAKSADEVGGSSKPVSASKADGGLLPYYATPGPAQIPISIVQSGIALPPATIGGMSMSGAERVRFAYEAGRQGAKQLQGETVGPSSMYRIADRSPVIYVVLKGQLGEDSYPMTVKTAKDYKKHMFLDADRPRPQVLAPDTVGRPFYSMVEADAYAKGAGLWELP